MVLVAGDTPALSGEDAVPPGRATSDAGLHAPAATPAGTGIFAPALVRGVTLAGVPETSQPYRLAGEQLLPSQS